MREKNLTKQNMTEKISGFKIVKLKKVAFC